MGFVGVLVGIYRSFIKVNVLRGASGAVKVWVLIRAWELRWFHTLGHDAQL